MAESLHFLGLCLLIGSIGAFDLRLLGVGRRVPLSAVHRFIPFGLMGFAINMTTGLLFLLTEPDQYIYNRSFHLKLVFLAIGGLNASLFYLTSWRTVFGSVAVYQAPVRARIIAAISLTAWISVIICGRMLTFFRPIPCDPHPAQIVLTCSP